jgi:transposase
MIYVEFKNQDEQKCLNDALKASKSKNWYRRLNIIALSATNYDVKQLSKMFNLCEATIRNYIHSYNQGGIDKLKPSKPTGRSPKISNWTRDQWNNIMKKHPCDYKKLGTQSNRWTLELLRLFLKEYNDTIVSIVSIHNSLKKTGVSIEKNRQHNNH